MASFQHDLFYTRRRALSLPEIVWPNVSREVQCQLEQLVSWLRGRHDVVAVWLHGGIFNRGKLSALVLCDQPGEVLQVGVFECRQITMQEIKELIESGASELAEYLCDGYRLCGADDVVFALEREAEALL